MFIILLIIRKVLISYRRKDKRSKEKLKTKYTNTIRKPIKKIINRIKSLFASLSINNFFLLFMNIHQVFNWFTAKVISICSLDPLFLKQLTKRLGLPC